MTDELHTATMVVLESIVMTLLLGGFVALVMALPPLFTAIGSLFTPFIGLPPIQSAVIVLIVSAILFSAFDVWRVYVA